MSRNMCNIQEAFLKGRIYPCLLSPLSYWLKRVRFQSVAAKVDPEVTGSRGGAAREKEHRSLTPGAIISALGCLQLNLFVI